MRICLISEEFQGVTGGGGIGACFSGLARFLAEIGHEVDVVITSEASQERRQAARSVRNIKMLFLDDFRDTIVNPAVPVDHIVRAYKVFLFLKGGTYDCVHFHEYLGLGYYTAMARKQGLLEDTVIITQTHGSSEWVRRHNLAVPDVSILEVESMERKQIELSDWVVSPSQYMLDWYAGNGVVLPNTSVINWILPKWVDAHQAETIKTRGLPAEALKELVFFGRHERRKGIEIFVEAISKIQFGTAFDLIFLGRFDLIDRENSVSYIMRNLMNFPGRIKFLNDYDQDRAHRYMSSRPGALCVMPSLIENSPCTVGEVMSLGLPFIATDVGGTHEMISEESRETALVSPTPHGLANKILHVIREGQPSIRSSMKPEVIKESWAAFHRDLPVQGLPRENAKPLVSIVLTHYERPKLLRRALNQIFLQDYENFEVIVVDDGSPSSLTKTALTEIEADFSTRNVKLVRSENKYLGAARNLGVGHAEGRYIMFHDDDNLSEPNQLSMFVRAAELGGFELLTSQYYVFKEIDHPEEGMVEYFPIGIGGDFSYFRNRFGDANALISKAAFTRIGGFSEHYGVGWEDWEFFLKAYIAGVQMGVVPIPLFRYFASGDGMLANGSPVHNNARIFDVVRQLRPPMTADMLQMVRKDEVSQQILDRAWHLLGRQKLGSLHRDLLVLEPNSPEARQILVELAFGLHRVEEAIDLGLGSVATRHQLAKLVSASKTKGDSALAGRFAADRLTVITNITQRAYTLSGWLATTELEPVTIAAVEIDGVSFRVIKQTAVPRRDVHEAYGRSGEAMLGFEVTILSGEPYITIDPGRLHEVHVNAAVGGIEENIRCFVEAQESDQKYIGWLEAAEAGSAYLVQLPNSHRDWFNGRIEIVVSGNPRDVFGVFPKETIPASPLGDGHFDFQANMVLAGQDARHPSSFRFMTLLSRGKSDFIDAFAYRSPNQR